MAHLKIRAFFLVWFWVVALSVDAQKIKLSEGVITFFSEAPLENIRAENKKVSSIFNLSSSEVAFSIPITEFQFEKKLMQQHFNEKYMESEKFPVSTFSGKFENLNPTLQGKQMVKAVGKLTIHGVTKNVEIPGSIEINQHKILMAASFMIKLSDYRIMIPQILWQNIAEQVEVKVDLTYKAQ